MSVVAPAGQPSCALATRLVPSVHAPGAARRFVVQAVRAWGLPQGIADRAGEAAGTLVTAVVRRAAEPLVVEVRLFDDTIAVQLAGHGLRDGRFPVTGSAHNTSMDIDFGSGRAWVHLEPLRAREGAGDTPGRRTGAPEARHARARRRSSLRTPSAGGSRELDPTTSTMEPHDTGAAEGPGHRDGVPTPRRG